MSEVITGVVKLAFGFISSVLYHAFVTSRIDNCNALLYGLPSYLIERLQYVLNAAARVIFLSRKADHVTPLLMD
jgi:hypothetical protein